MTSKRFPKLPDVSDDKPAQFSAKKPASQSFTNLTNNSSFSLTRNTFSEEDSDDLLNWIDGLKNRASNLFEKQRNELVQLRKEAHREQLRQKYREHIDSTSFDKLGELLEKNQNQSGIAHGEIREDVKKRGYGSNSPSEIGPDEENSQDYVISEKEEEEAGTDEEILEFQYPGSNQFARGSQNLADRELADLARAAEYGQEEEEDDIVEILSDESADEEEESEAQDEESEEEIAEEIDVSEELIPSEEEAEEEEEEEDYHGEEIEENEAISANSNAQFARPYPVSFHVQNGRPRLSDIPYNYSSNNSSYRQNADQEIEEGDGEDGEAEEVEEHDYMESEDLNEISDNLDAVESKYSDDLLEDDVERELESRNYSESEKESYYSQVEEQQSEGVYFREQYAESEMEEESYDEDDEAENENEDGANNQRYGLQHAEVKVRSISPSANLFAQENVTFQRDAKMDEPDFEGQEKEEYVVLSDGSSSPPHAEAETSFHDFSDEADNIQSEDENQENSYSSSEAEVSEIVEKADAEISSKTSGSVSENQEGNEASSPENAELSQFLSQLQDESLNNNLFANLAQEALGAAHTEADFDDEINAALQEGAEKFLAEQQADAETLQENLEQAPESPDHKAHNLVDGADQENEQSHVPEIEPEIASEVEMENVPENISEEESPKSPEVALPPTSPRLLSFKTIVEEDPKTVLKQLKETEKKFNIKLDAVEKLTSEIGEVSDPESARNSPPQMPESSFYDAEVHEENTFPDAGTKEVEGENMGMYEESTEEEANTEKDKENEADSKFEESPPPCQQDSPDVLPKPKVPILEDIEGEDEEMVNTSTAESDQSAEIREDMESYVVVVEPTADEDVLTVYDEFTEVEQADILAPSEIEEPVAKETVADAVSVSKVALEFVSEEGEEASINPSEIIEPCETAEVEVAVVETFEEVLDFAVPTSIVELESMRNTPVSTAAFSAEEVDSEKEAAEVGTNDLQTEISDDKEDAEMNSSLPDIEGEKKAEKEEDVSPESSEIKHVTEARGLDDAEKSEVEVERKPAFEVGERPEVSVEEPEVPVTENACIDEEADAGPEDSESVGSSNPDTSPLDNSAENVALSPISRLFGKRKLEDADTSSSPVKKLKKAFSKLNPFNWRLSEGPSLKQEIVESMENEGNDDANAEGEQVISVSEESAPLPSEFYLASFDFPEQKHVSVGGDLDDVSTKEIIESSPRLGETKSIKENVVEMVDKILVENTEEDSVMADAPKVDEPLYDSVKEELPDFEPVSVLSQEGKKDSTLAKDIADENMEIEPETFVTEPDAVDADSVLENKAENIAIDSESFQQDQQPEIPADADMDEETPAVRERIILLTVPPLPRPDSFMRIAQANLEDLENEMHVDDEHSNLKASEVLENEVSSTENLPTFNQPVSEIAAYIGEAVTSLVEENEENPVNKQEDEQAVDSPNGEGNFAKEIVSPVYGDAEDGKVESSTGALSEDGQAEILSKNEKSEEQSEDYIQETEQETVETQILDTTVEASNEVIDNLEDLGNKPEAEKHEESAMKEAKTETESEAIFETLNQEDADADEFHDAEDSDHPTEVGSQGDNTTESALEPTIAEENVATDQENEIAEEEFQDAEDDDAVSQHDEQNDVVEDPQTSADIQNQLGSESVDQEDKAPGPTETLQKEALISTIAIESANSDPVVAPILDDESRPENEIEQGEAEVAIKTPSINLTAPSTGNLSYDLKEEEGVTIVPPAEDPDEKEVLNENEPSRLPEKLSAAEDANVHKTRPQSRGLSKLISLFVKKAEEKIEEKSAHHDLGLSLAPAFEENKKVTENSDESESMDVDHEIEPEETEIQQKVSSTEAKETGVDEVVKSDENVETDEKTITHAASPVIEKDQLQKVEEYTPQIVPATPERQEVKKEHKTPPPARTPRTPRSARSHRTPKSARKTPIQRKTPQKKGAVSSPPVNRVLRNQTTENQGEIPASVLHEGSEEIVPEALKTEENLPETEPEEQIGESAAVENAATNQGSPSKRTRSQAKSAEDEVVQEPSVESEKHAKEEDKTAVPAEDKNDASRSDSKPEITAPKRKRGRPPKNRNKKVEKNTNVAKKDEIPDLSPTASKTLIAKSVPLKKRGKGIKPSTEIAKEEKDHEGNDTEHLKIPAAEDEDHPALRTRSRSPIKRSIQELSTEIDQAPQRKKRNLRQRNATKKVDDEEAQQEQEARGRTRKR